MINRNQIIVTIIVAFIALSSFLIVERSKGIDFSQGTNPASSTSSNQSTQNGSSSNKLTASIAPTLISIGDEIGSKFDVSNTQANPDQTSTYNKSTNTQELNATISDHMITPKQFVIRNNIYTSFLINSKENDNFSIPGLGINTPININSNVINFYPTKQGIFPIYINSSTTPSGNLVIQ